VPITLLYYFVVLLVMVLLIINVVYPLLVSTEYKMFFMFRKNKFKSAVNTLEESQRKIELKKPQRKVSEIKKEDKE